MRTRTFIAAFSIILALFAVTPLRAQVGGAGGGGDEGVSVAAMPQFTSITPGQNLAVAVTFDFTRNLHIWPNNPEVPKGVDGLSAIPTTITIAENATLPKGVAVLLDRIQWPTPEKVDVAAGSAKLAILAYHHTTTVYIPVTVAADAPAGSFTIPLVVSFQACDEKACFPPEDRELLVTLDIGTKLVPANTELFASFDPKAFSAPAAPVKPAPQPPVNTGASSRQGAIVIDLGLFGWAITLDGAVGYALLFIVAIIGGFVLNLTPCVLPVIPLKILGLQSQAGSRSRMLFLGFVMFCGLVFFWLAIGALLSLGVLGAISEISAYWQFNLGVALFMALMGLGMFGLFTVGLPTWVYNIDVKHDSAKGSFGFGVMSAVLATPCVAPLMGGIAAGSSKLPTPVALLVFVFVGIGMGLPYLILAAYPKLVSWIPRAGPGSELLKQVLGLLMIAISLFFLGNSLITMVAEYPWLGKQLHWWAVAVALLIASGWLIVRTFQITTSPVQRGAFSVLALLFTAAGFLWANSQTRQAEVTWTRAEAARLKALEGAPAQLTDQLWQEYVAVNVDRTLAEGSVVVMDFTADWCLICKTLETTVLHTDAVEAELKAGGVRSFSVDLTTKKAPGWKHLAALGQKGVPSLAIMGPGLKEPWVRNAYTAGEVIEAIRQARGTPKAVATPTPPGMANSTGKP